MTREKSEFPSVNLKDVLNKGRDPQVEEGYSLGNIKSLI